MQQLPLVRTPPRVREDFVPADAYVLPEYVQIEEATLWGKVWLIAAREEELPNPGDYHVFDIGKESILLVRQKDRSVKAFYNVCQHRGRRLKDNISGRTGDIIRCNFHGWRFHIDGQLEAVLNEADWSECPTFKRDELNLKPVKVESFGGWLWVSMDPDIKPVRDYLGEVAPVLEAYEMEKYRFAWYKTVVVPCNWKVIVDAFNEAYHAPATHPWVFKHGAPMSHTKPLGIHGAFWQHAMVEPHRGEKVITPAPYTSMKERMDYFVKKMSERGRTMVTPYLMTAVERVQEMPDDTDPMTILIKIGEYQAEEMAKAGIEWPQGVTPEFMGSVATEYHIFPNTTLVPGVDSTLWHRMRPNGDDPASAIWDIWSIDRYPEGKAPPLKRDYYATPAEFKGQNPFLEEDFGNMEAVQKGMWSRGFEGGRTNPKQESSVSNFHRVLYDYYAGRAPE